MLRTFVSCVLRSPIAKDRSSSTLEMEKTSADSCNTLTRTDSSELDGGGDGDGDGD
jgi:hypothetical protein